MELRHVARLRQTLWRVAVVGGMLLVPATNSAAQQALSSGSVAQSSTGRAGQRQTREQALPNALPMARISNRIRTRVESRIHNRIDRNYTPQTDLTHQLEAVEGQMRLAPRPR